MPWLLVDLLLGLLAVGVLALLGLRLWRQVRALMRSVGAASAAAAPQLARLSAAQAGRGRRDP